MNAKIAILIAEAAESVKMLSWPSLNLFVNGIAEDAADMSKYATICKFHFFASKIITLQIYISRKFANQFLHYLVAGEIDQSRSPAIEKFPF